MEDVSTAKYHLCFRYDCAQTDRATIWFSCGVRSCNKASILVTTMDLAVVLSRQFDLGRIATSVTGLLTDSGTREECTGAHAEDCAFALL